MKLKALLNDLMEKANMGRVAACVWVVDYRRGLPHAHILLILERDTIPITPAEIEIVISAEIPDKSNHHDFGRTSPGACRCEPQVYDMNAAWMRMARISQRRFSKRPP